MAPSGTGKTTLLEGVIAALSARGHRVGILKHDAHRLDLDKKGKDTWRFRRAGAWRAVIAGDEQLAVFSRVQGELSLGGLVDTYLLEADLVLTEGFRKAELPTLRVHRAARGEDPSWVGPRSPMAWVSDEALERAVPVLPLNEPARVADFLEEQFLTNPATARRATIVLPAQTPDELAALPEVAARLGPLCEGRVLAVHPRHLSPPPGLPAVPDIRPDVGPLGALLTGLAAAPTPEVVLVGSRHHGVSPDVVAALLRAGTRRADVVTPVEGPWREPLLAVYGHRCLGAIQAALVSGEPKMDGWWGQVRIATVPALALGLSLVPMASPGATAG